MAENTRDTVRLRESVEVPGEDDASQLLREAIRHLHRAGNDSVNEAANIIGRLRLNPTETAHAARRWLDARESAVMLRWSLVYVLATVRHPEYLELLRQEATRRLPTPKHRAGECERSDGAELVVVMAIHGLEYLALGGNDRAVEHLLEVVERQDRKSLREPAAIAAVRARPALRDRVAQLLPSEERYVLDLRTATMDDFAISAVSLERQSAPRSGRPSGPPPPLPTHDAPARSQEA